jgi:hypothetical protein
MATGPASELSSEAPPAPADFGPTLPQLLQRRFGIRERAVTIVAVTIVAVVAIAALVRSYAVAPRHLVYRAGPTFNLQYPAKTLHRKPPHAGELVRLEAHRGTLSASITVSPLHLPPYAGNVTSGLLPVYEHGYAEGLRRASPGFRLRDEGSARVNDVPGYQLGFGARPAGGITWGRDMLLVPDDERAREGVVLKLRQTKLGGPFTKRDKHVLDRVKKAFKSFRFGTDPP